MKQTIAAWPDFPLQSNATSEAVIISPENLRLLIDKRVPEITHIEKLNSQSRNPVYRLRTADDSYSIITKWYLPWLDHFYDSRFRREEKVLSLLNRWFNGRVPEVYGGIVTRSFAVLVEQNVGEKTLYDVLNDKEEKERFDIALQGVEFLADFHRICQTHYSVFYRTCQSADLDRLTTKTYLRRAQIAIGRLLLLGAVFEEKISPTQISQINVRDLETLATDRLGKNFFKSYSTQIITPLLRASRQILHNSFSPFHLVCNGHLSLVDFETMSVGASQIDLAEFVGSPEIALSFERQLGLVERYYELRNDERLEKWPEFMRNYHGALTVRSLDYAGTTAFRCAKYIGQGKEEKAAKNLNRARQYRSNVIEALKASDAADILQDIPQI